MSYAICQDEKYRNGEPVKIHKNSCRHVPDKPTAPTTNWKGADDPDGAMNIAKSLSKGNIGYRAAKCCNPAKINTEIRYNK